VDFILPYRGGLGARLFPPQLSRFPKEFDSRTPRPNITLQYNHRPHGTTIWRCSHSAQPFPSLAIRRPFRHRPARFTTYFSSSLSFPFFKPSEKTFPMGTRNWASTCATLLLRMMNTCILSPTGDLKPVSATVNIARFRLGPAALSSLKT